MEPSRLPTLHAWVEDTFTEAERQLESQSGQRCLQNTEDRGADQTEIRQTTFRTSISSRGISLNQLIEKGWVGRGFYDQICLGKNGLKKINTFSDCRIVQTFKFFTGIQTLQLWDRAGVSKLFFCQGPEGKYFRPCGSNCLHYNRLILLLWQQSCCKSMDNMQWVWLCSNKTLFIKTSKGQAIMFQPLE